MAPETLRSALTYISNQFLSGNIADSNEAFDTVLQSLHLEDECCGVSATTTVHNHTSSSCIAHQVFGLTFIEQISCLHCGATSEPTLTSAFSLLINASEVISYAKKNKKKKNVDFSFGKILSLCLEGASSSGGKCNNSSCTSTTTSTKRSTHLIDSPSAIALSIGWESTQESTEALLSFYNSISYVLNATDLLSSNHSATGQFNPESLLNEANMYYFRGMVCFYGCHYVFIYRDGVNAASEPLFLLFDDSKIRPLGSHWEEVMQECLKAKYQPVLLLYERREGI